MNNIIKINVPKENVSDQTHKVIKLEFNNGDFVNKGNRIAELETSKIIFDLESPIDGYIYFFCKANEEVKVGSLLAIVSKDKSAAETFFNDEIQNVVSSVFKKEFKNVKFSKIAEKLIVEKNIPFEVFNDFGIVEKNDVEDWLKKNSNEQNLNIQSSELKSIGNNIVLIGGGRHTRACIDIIKQSANYKISGIIYVNKLPDEDYFYYPLLGNLDNLEYIFDNIAKNAVISIGGLENMNERNLIYQKLKSFGFLLPNIIHPKAIIEPSVIIGEGNQLFAGTNIGSYSKIGNNCILNSNSIISHDCTLGDNIHMTPGSILAGGVNVGNNTIIGMGATVTMDIKIGKNVIIYNGKNIFGNISDNAIVK
jgi:sugar O-acyltransferase (sialic acid O-acetyltransferase NeuD family)